MGLRILHPGLNTTVQDQGRPGFREWGVPVGGAFDGGAAALANALVANSPGAAVLEMALLGGTFEATGDLGLAFAGAPMEAVIVGRDGTRRPVRSASSFSLRAGEQLRVGGGRQGARAYLAVKGGWLTAAVLGSRSSERRLQTSDFLQAAPSHALVRRLDQTWVLSDERWPIRIVAGPDQTAIDLNELEQALFRTGPDCNRMGLRLEGRPLNVTATPERLSMPLAPGALQVAGGQVIVLGVAGGTMGGYPHVAQVISADFDRIAQIRPGAPLRFQVVDIDEARRLDRAHRDERARFVASIRELARQADGTVLGD